MYYDLLFPYRIEASAGIAQDTVTGENTAAYTKITLSECKKAITEEEYREMHEKGRHNVSKMLNVDVSLIVPINSQEYEDNVDREE